MENFDKPNIFTMMKQAESKLKYPSIEYPLDTFNGKIRFSLASKRHVPGFSNYIYITQIKQGDSVYLGKVTQDGKLVVTRDCPQALKDIIIKVYNEPLNYVIEAGRRTGVCCFCAKELTHPVSIKVGYGPVCASKYGLPWDELDIEDARLDNLKARVDEKDLK